MKYLFDRDAGLIVVLAELSGPAGRALIPLGLDTGATTTLISWQTAIRLGYDPAVSPQRVRIITGSSEEYCAPVRLVAVRALGKEVREVDALCHDLPARSRVRGLLGLNFLRNFDLRMNFKQGFITLR